MHAARLFTQAILDLLVATGIPFGDSIKPLASAFDPPRNVGWLAGQFHPYGTH
jgi:hypothetical protein